MFKKQSSVQPEPANLDAIIKRLDNMQQALLWLVKHNNGATGTGRVSDPTVETLAPAPQVRTTRRAQNHRLRWTQAEIARAIELDNMGINHAEIAKALGRTRRAVNQALVKQRARIKGY